MKKIHAACLSLSLLVVPAVEAAAPGDLDLSFNGTGIVATLPTTAGYGFNGIDGRSGVIQQADGKLVAVGYRYNKKKVKSFAVLRYNSNGTPDTDFNGTGEVITNVSGLLTSADYAQAVIQQTDGKLVAAGNSFNGANDDFALARYNKDGSLDVTFNETGVLTTAFGSGNDRCTSVIQQADGKIVAAGNAVIAGNTDFAMARYESDGSPDTSFGTNGLVTTDLNGSQNYGRSVIQLHSSNPLIDGKLLMVGYSDYEFVMVRYNEDGSLDTTFNGSGKLFAGISANPDFGTTVIQQSDEKIVIAGYSSPSPQNSDLAIARYNLDGTFDTSFSGDGKLVSADIDVVTSVVQQPDGKLVMGGYSSNGSNLHFALARLNTDGTPDTTFSADGVLTTSVGSVIDQAFSLIQQTDGKLVLAGYGNSGKFNYMALVRYHSENDTDDDGVPNSLDAFPTDPTESVNTDGDLIGNNADPDDDNDTVVDGTDNCPLLANPAQTDTDNDGLGDACDDDSPLLYTAKGTKAKDRAGYAVAFAGDVDKDGYGDYVVGMSGFDPAGKIDAGRAEVRSGKTGSVLMSVDGDAAKDGMGYAVAGNADIDNDGNLDVVVGAPQADNPTLGLLDAGSATVLYGPDGVRRNTFYGLTAKAAAGSAVALGNVNSDAYADILIGAPKDDDPTHPFTTIIDAGSVLVRSGDPLTNNIVLKIFYGAMAKAYAGTSVATGDFDGDGRADIIVGAPNDDDTSDPDITYIDAGSVSVYDIGGAYLMNEYGATAKAFLGKSVASADVDSDGSDEVLVGAPGDDLLDANGKAIRKDAGSISLYTGGGGLWWQSFGRTPKAGLGNSVAFGDVNGDLVPDIIAGASKDDKPAKKPLKDVGSVSVWNGADFSLITTVYGKVTKDYFGSAVSSGDVNGEGNDDLIIGIGGADLPAVLPAKPVKDAGSVQVLSGVWL